MQKRFSILQLRPEDKTSDSEYTAICTSGNLSPETADDLIATAEKEETPYAHKSLHRFVEQYRS